MLLFQVRQPNSLESNGVAQRCAHARRLRPNKLVKLAHAMSSSAPMLRLDRTTDVLIQMAAG